MYVYVGMDRERRVVSREVCVVSYADCF
jgi:hypothetical protein